jgi:hypothetical protein
MIPLSITNVTNIITCLNTTQDYQFLTVANSDGSYHVGKVITIVVLSSGNYTVNLNAYSTNELIYPVIYPSGTGIIVLSQYTNGLSIYKMSNTATNTYGANAVNTFVSFWDMNTNKGGWIQLPIYTWKGDG